MKTILMSVAWLLCVASAWAQTEGTIRYTDTRKLSFQGANIPEEMLSQMPSETSSNFVLKFNEEASLYENAPAEEEAMNHAMSSQSGNMQIVVKMDQPENILYRDLATQNSLQQLEWMGERFLIEGSAALEWRVTTEQRMILGYPCMKALAMRDSTEVEAWFTPQIALSIGPDNFGGLPGMILEVSTDDGSRTLTATEVSMEPLEEKLKKPKRGEKMSREEFQAFQAEKLEEMEAMRGEGGGVFIIREGGE